METLPFVVIIPHFVQHDMTLQMLLLVTYVIVCLAQAFSQLFIASRGNASVSGAFIH